MTDLSPDERKLLPLATVNVLRGLDFRRNKTPSFWSFPDCHECGQPVDQVISQEKHFPTVTISIACKPCGHKTELSRESLHRISKAAVQAASELENRSFLDAPDWLGGGVCCGCNGTGGPVVYRNFEDKPFCAHCSECSCGTVPCSRPTPAPADSLREQYAAAIYEHHNPGFRWADAHPDNLIAYGADADAVLAVRDRELEQLRSDLAWARDNLLEAQAEATDEATRADQAEAALERVRQFLDQDRDSLCCSHVTGQIRAALNPQEQQP